MKNYDRAFIMLVFWALNMPSEKGGLAWALMTLFVFVFYMYVLYKGSQEVQR